VGFWDISSNTSFGQTTWFMEPPSNTPKNQGCGGGGKDSLAHVASYGCAGCGLLLPSPSYSNSPAPVAFRNFCVVEVFGSTIYG